MNESGLRNLLSSGAGVLKSCHEDCQCAASCLHDIRWSKFSAKWGSVGLLGRTTHMFELNTGSSISLVSMI